MAMIAKLHLEAALRNGITYLKHSYYTPPFKIANITEDKKAHQLQLTLMCSSPGILDEDAYTLQVDIADGANLHLHTQSYQRLFNMKVGATQNMQVNLGIGAAFTYLPHPSVPHQDSIFKATNQLFLKNNCLLIWGEVFTCGRMLKGEVFTFTKYHSITEIYLNKKLVIKENLLMQPAIIKMQRLGLLEGYTHQASFICINETLAASAFADKVHKYLEHEKEIIYGVTIAPINGIIVRILGYKAEQLHSCLKAIAKL